MDFGVVPVKKTKRMTEDMVLSDSVSGVSRSGRVRKKSAKLMEMEDFHSPFYESDAISDIQKARKKSGGKVMSPTSLGGNLNSTSPLPPLITNDIRTSNNLGGGKRKTASQMTPPLRGVASTMLSPSHKQPLSSTPLSKGERVIAIKQPTPPASSFETLSGNAYLIGDDIHFITGEPVDSDADANGTDSESPLSPLKIDVGSMDESRVSLHEESGLKMKFILSPKTSKIESHGKNSSVSPQKKRVNVSARSAPKKLSGSTSRTKKTKFQPIVESQGSSTLALLASGGVMPGDDSAGLMDSSDEDQIEDKLVIAEPLRTQSSDKSKKRSFGNSSITGNTNNIKSRKKIGKSTSGSHSSGINSSSILGDATGQQQSVYMKEKNSSKKKPAKKIMKPKEKPEKKRELSAYMLWCRDYRKIIVSENPGLDFAAISRRLGEIWKSLSDAEKLKWKGKATKQSPNVPRGKTVDSEKSKSPAKPSGGKLHDPYGSQEVHKAIGTSPLDVAAYLKLLGESLSIIGQRLTEHEGQIAVSGSLSVLLDSTLCALGPLLCLTSEVKELDGCSKETQESILDNIAYIMPGL